MIVSRLKTWSGKEHRILKIQERNKRIIREIRSRNPKLSSSEDDGNIVKLLKSKSKRERAVGMVLLGNDIDALYNFAKNSAYKDVRMKCVNQLLLLKKDGNEAESALENLVYFSNYEDVKLFVVPHLKSETLRKVLKYTENQKVKEEIKKYVE
ncbi:MAG: hypothetical protein QXT05_01830 [Candidatus Bilamarchaeaceae archaeon]